MPVLGTFSNISKRGFGGFVPKYVTTDGLWVPTGTFSTDPFPSAYKPFNACALSGDGQRQLALFGNYSYKYTAIGAPTSAPTQPFLSTDFGSNFNAVTSSPTTSRCATSSVSGQYLWAASGGASTLIASSDFGASFTTQDLSAYVIPGTSVVLPLRVCVGNSGQRVLLIVGGSAGGNHRLLTSQDYGSTFATSYVPLDGADTPLLHKIKIQNNGERMFVTGTRYTGGSYVGSNLWRSVNNGTTWASIFSTATTHVVDCAVSDSGQYITFVTGDPYTEISGGSSVQSDVYRSTDYGFNFQFVRQIYNCQSVAMSADGQVQVIGNQGMRLNPLTNAGLWLSLDYGQTWARTAILADFVEVAVSKDGNVRLGAGQVPWESQSNRLAQSYLYLNIA